MKQIYYFSWRNEWPFALVLAFLLLAVYWLTMPPGVTFEDTGLFATVCYNAGIAHPPGYPLHTLLCIPFARLADFLPLNPAQATALLSSVAAVAAAVLFYEIAGRLWRRRALAFFLAAALGLGDRFWSQAIIPETYTLNALLVVATLFFILRFMRHPKKCQPLFIAAFLFGLGLSNHWPLYLITAPTFAIMVFGGKTFKRHLTTANIGRACFFVALGLSPYLYLLYRADFAPTPFSPIGEAENWREFFAHISRASYRARETAEVLSFSTRLTYLGEGARLVAWEYGLGGLVLAVLGALRFFYRRPWRISAGVLFGALASGPVLGFILDYHLGGNLGRAIFSVYPLPAMPFFLIFIGEALAFIKGVSGGAAALLFLLSCGVTNWRANDRSEDFLAENYSAAVFAALPQGALLTTNNDFIFPLFYRRYALNERPDLTISNKFRASENHNEDLNFVMDAKEFSNGYRDYGLFQKPLPGMPKNQVEAALPPSLLEYYGTLPALYGKDKNIWNDLAIRTAILNAARALTILSHTAGLNDEQSVLADTMRIFPEGLLGEVFARANRQAKPYTLTQLRANLDALYTGELNLPGQWRSLLRQMDAAYHISIGDNATARALLEEAVHIDPSSANHAAVDLLQILAFSGDWRAYEKRRRRSPIKNKNLAEFDRQCAEVLGRTCRKDEEQR